MEAEERWWQYAWREMQIGWRLARRQHVWLLRWVLPLVLTAEVLWDIALAPRWTGQHTRELAEAYRQMVTGSVLLIVGWYCGYRIGRHDRDGM